MSREGIAFDYSSPAELFLARRRGRHTDYRRFATAAEAIGYAVEELRALRSLTAWMQVGDERFNKDEIHRLYDDGDFPLSKSSGNRASQPLPASRGRKNKIVRGCEKRVLLPGKTQDFEPPPDFTNPDKPCSADLT